MSRGAATRKGFECQSCGKRISSMAYWAACPDCGGHLKERSVSYR